MHYGSCLRLQHAKARREGGELKMPESFRPIFIVGCQRSGSTMLGAMLGAHPKIVCLPEAQFIGDFLPADPNPPVDPTELLDAIENHWRFRIWDFDLAGARPQPDEIAPSFAATICWLARRYAVFLGKPEAKLWVEQQPGHIKRALHLAKHFPDARFLHIVRDGRAVALSLMARDWGPKRALAAAKYWQERVAIGLALEIELGPTCVRRVRYEAVLDQPRDQLTSLAAFLGLNFDTAMERPTGLRLPRFTLEDHQLVGSALIGARASSWRQQMRRRDVEIFEYQTGDLLPLLGYELTCGAHPPPIGEFEKLRLALEDHALRMVCRLRFARRRRRHLGAQRADPLPAGGWEQPA
jgi:Sulfotransferase family